MDIFSSNKIMVLDTEYETSPKRLLAIAYLVYTCDNLTNKWIKSKSIDFIKFPKEIFKVDESGEAFQYHKLSNSFLEENGVDIRTALENFSNALSEVDIIVGQNILTADIHIIRKEAIGVNLWFEKIRTLLKNKNIYDTMLSFRNKNPSEKSSLDSIYSFLFQKEMKNHHDATHDCKNTFKCFEKMVEDGYIFENQTFKFSEDIFEDLMKVSKKCNICESKIPETNNTYQFKDNLVEAEDKLYKISNNFLQKNDEICKRCMGNLEVLVTSLDHQMVNLIKLKYYDSFIKEFFNIIGEESTIVYLVSNYKDKDEIKKLGGRWDGKRKSWYFTYNSKTSDRVKKFSKWIKISEEV